jgi:hypothetical protein
MKNNKTIIVLFSLFVLFYGCYGIKDKTPARTQSVETDGREPGNSIKKEAMAEEKLDPIVINAMSYQTSGITNFNDSFKNGSDAHMARIVEINYEGSDLKILGAVERLPNLKKLKIGFRLTSVDTSLLPRSLESLDLGQNKMRSFETGNLPGSLKFLNLSLNPLEGTFEVTENMSNIVYLGVAGTKINRVTGLENLHGEGLNIHFIQSPVSNPEEFIKLRNVNVLTFSVPGSYSNDDINILRKAINEQNPQLKVLTIQPYMEGGNGSGLIDDGT